MSKALIIAEIGLNHGGDFDWAKRMVEAAKEAGADIAKFQMYDPISVLGCNSPYLKYAIECQFTKAQHTQLQRHCERVGIEYLVSVFNIDDVAWADGLCKRHKVASRMNKDFVFLNQLCSTGKQVIMSLQKDTKKPYLEPPGLTYMYCATTYPASPEDFKGFRFDRNHGLSSHCPSVAPSIAAFNAGARIIEHHVTFSRKLEGCDMSSSITFPELKELVDYVRSH